MKKFYLLIALLILLSNAYIVRAQLQYSGIKNTKVQRPKSIDIYLLHPNSTYPSDFNIIEQFPDQTDASFFRLTITTGTPTYLNYGVICTKDSIVKALNAGDSINETSTIWTNSTQKTLYLANYNNNPIGEWVNVTHKFIGLRMYKNGDYFYGYVQMSVVPVASWQPTTTIIDMAYQQTPNKGLKAGQTVGVNHIILNQANYYLNDHQLNILADKAEMVSITDISGHQLFNSDVKSNKSFDLSSYANGIYLLKITTDNGILTDKILLR